MLEIIKYLKARYVNEKAQGLVEYAMLLGFVVVVGAAVVGSGQDGSVASHVKSIFEKVKGIVANADK